MSNTLEQFTDLDVTHAYNALVKHFANHPKLEEIKQEFLDVYAPMLEQDCGISFTGNDSCADHGVEDCGWCGWDRRCHCGNRRVWWEYDYSLEAVAW